jgi:hypothetical protein
MKSNGHHHHHHRPVLFRLATARFSVLDTTCNHKQQQLQQQLLHGTTFHASTAAKSSSSSSSSLSTPLDPSQLDLFFQDGPPIFPLTDLLREHSKLSSCAGLSSSSSSLLFGQRLWQSLARHGFLLLTCPIHSTPALVLQRLQTSLCRDLFPTIPHEQHDTNHHHHHHQGPQSCQKQKKNNLAHLTTSRRTYVSERGIPMYKLGYELTEDGVREIFRIAAGCPDDNDSDDDDDDDDQAIMQKLLFAEQPRHVRTTWLQALGLMRHVTDAALDLLLLALLPHQHQQQQQQQQQLLQADTTCQQQPPSHRCRRKPRPYSGGSSWNRKTTSSSASRNGNHHSTNENHGDQDDDGCYYKTKRCLQERKGDFSVLYAMHYFNTDNQQQQQQQHVNLSCSLATKNDTPHPQLYGQQQPQEEQPGDDGQNIPLAVKAHVDPSLLVMEPFLACPDYYYCEDDDTSNDMDDDDDAENSNYKKDVVAGLQLWHEPTGQWWHVDGPDSIIPPLLSRHLQQQQQTEGESKKKQHVMLLFCGKGLVEATTAGAATATNGESTAAVSSQQLQQEACRLPPLQATLHRVVHGDGPRRTVIYEQKYEEFYPTPDFD